MNELEEKLNQVLSNPQMMQQIMTLAQSMSSAAGERTPPQPRESPDPPPMDAGFLQTVAGLAGKTAVDQNQHNLLLALSPYVGQDRVCRLEKAMRAAKLAAAASAWLQPDSRRLPHV